MISMFDMTMDSEDFKTPAWQDSAVWLPFRDVPLSCYNSRGIVYGQDGCAAESIAAYLDVSKIRLRTRPSVADIVQTLRDNGDDESRVVHVNMDDVYDKDLVYATCGSGRAERACLLPMKNREEDEGTLRSLREVCSACSRLFCVLFNPVVYPFGHCLTVHRRGAETSIVDPMFGSTRAVAVSDDDLLLILTGARVVIAK